MFQRFHEDTMIGLFEVKDKFRSRGWRVEVDVDKRDI